MLWVVKRMSIPFKGFCYWLKRVMFALPANCVYSYSIILRDQNSNCQISETSHQIELITLIFDNLFWHFWFDSRSTLNVTRNVYKSNTNLNTHFKANCKLWCMRMPCKTSVWWLLPDQQECNNHQSNYHKWHTTKTNCWYTQLHHCSWYKQLGHKTKHSTTVYNCWDTVLPAY